MLPVMDFYGKWTFSQSGSWVQIDPAGGLLLVGAAATDGRTQFNAYGDADAFVLQGSNGLYVTSAGGSYTANGQRDGALNQFKLVAGTGGSYVLDLGVHGAGPQFDWNNDGGKLGQAAVENPPPSALFTQTIVTPSLAVLKKTGFTSPDPTLAWAFLEDVDFSKSPITFSNCNFDHANLERAKFRNSTSFAACSGSGANFRGVQATAAIFSESILIGADFTSAVANQAFFNGTNFDNATLTDAKMAKSYFTKTSKGVAPTFKGAHLERTDFSQAVVFSDADFTGAFAQGANFDGSSVTGPMKLQGANLTGATLNKGTTTKIIAKMLEFDTTTNLTQATMQSLDLSDYDLSNMNFSHADLTGCKMDRCKLVNAEFGYATLNDVTLTGGISMQGVNLSNASMKGADLTGAQLGAISLLFLVPKDSRDYESFLTALKAKDATAVTAIFKKNGVDLQGPVTVFPTAFSAPDTSWQVELTTPVALSYTVQADTGGLGVYQPTVPAVLLNAFMVNVNLTSANLFGVRASGVQLYATAGKTVNLNRAKLNGVQFNNANLGNIDLSQAPLPGVNFDYSMLTGANFNGAEFLVDARGSQSTFNGTNLQGANFTDAKMNNVVMTNAAVSVVSPMDERAYAGVWLFKLSAQDAASMTAELDAASPDPQAPSSAPKHQFNVPISVLPYLSVPGPVPPQLRKAFGDAHITLNASALQTIALNSIYWKIKDPATSYVVFPSCSEEFQPALGVAPGDTFTTVAEFYLPLSLEPHLAAGSVPPDVAAAFAEAGYPLTDDATIAVAQHPTEWQVIDTTATPEGAELLAAGANLVTVYSMWLNLQSGTTCSYVITVRPAIANTINIFGNFSLALSQRTTILRLASTSKLKGWKVSNDADNPFNPVKDYIQFQVFTNDSGGVNVYGSMIRIIRLVTPTQLAYFNIPCSRTVLEQTVLKPNCICPNSNTVATNTANALPFGEWMWARYLPAPPLCIPDPGGGYFCPV